MIKIVQYPNNNLVYCSSNMECCSVLINSLQISNNFINSFIVSCYNWNKRASLACAARLADTLCPPEAPFGRLEVTSVNYKGDIISKYVHLS